MDLYNGNLAFAYNAKVKNSIYNLCDDMVNNRLLNGISDDYIYNVKHQRKVTCDENNMLLHVFDANEIHNCAEILHNYKKR